VDSGLLVYIFGVVLFALGICVSIALHEAGHMMTAKWFGMNVRRYFIGFGPTLFSFRRKQTEYGLKALPLGGFCDIAGMTALDEVTPEESPKAMWRYPAWKRTVVLSAGSITHFIIGFIVLYLLAVSMGLPNINGKAQIESLSCVKNATTEQQLRNYQCGPGDPTPAAEAGIRPGDVITAVGGTAVSNWDDVRMAIRESSGPTPIAVDRDGEIKRLSVNVMQVKRPVLTQQGKAPRIVSVGMIGIGVQAKFQYGALDALPATTAFTGEMFANTWSALLDFPSRIPKVVEAIFGGERDPNTPVSVVGASRIGGEAAERGLWELFLLMLAALNFFVGIFNLLPLLPLDGGHIAVTWYEKVRDTIRRLMGKAAMGPVDYTKLSAVTMVFVIIGGAVVLLTVTADIVNPIQLPE